MVFTSTSSSSSPVILPLPHRMTLRVCQGGFMHCNDRGVVSLMAHTSVQFLHPLLPSLFSLLTPSFLLGLPPLRFLFTLTLFQLTRFLCIASSLICLADSSALFLFAFPFSPSHSVITVDTFLLLFHDSCFQSAHQHIRFPPLYLYIIFFSSPCSENHFLLFVLLISPFPLYPLRNEPRWSKKEARKRGRSEGMGRSKGSSSQGDARRPQRGCTDLPFPPSVGDEDITLINSRGLHADGSLSY